MQYLPWFLKVLQCLQNHFRNAFQVPQNLQKYSNMTPKWLQEPPKTLPRQSQDGPESSQDRPESPKDRSKRLQEVPLGDSWTTFERSWVAPHQILNQKIATRWISCLLFINSCSSGPPFLQYLPMFLRVLQYLQELLPNRFPTAFGPPKVLQQDSKMTPGASQDDPKVVPRAPKTGSRDPKIGPRDHTIAPRGLLGRLLD